MPATPRKTYRIPPATLDKVVALAERWGGIAPASETAVIVEAIARAFEAEFVPASKPPRKRGR